MAVSRYHIIIDIASVEVELLRDTKRLEDFLTTLPGKIGMHILHGPVVVTGVPENPGLTGFVIIDFSHISIHTFTETGQAFIDIFSCKPFQEDSAMAAALEYCQATVDQAKIQTVCWE